jgi:hypothetical protein
VTNTPEGHAKNRRVEIFLSTKALMPIRKKEPKDKTNGKIEISTIPWFTERPVWDRKQEELPEKCNKEYYRRLRKHCSRDRFICRQKCDAKYALSISTNPWQYCTSTPFGDPCRAKREAERKRIYPDRLKCREQCDMEYLACSEAMRKFTSC